MTIENEAELAALLRIGRIVGLTLQHMSAAIEPGMSTAALDDVGARFLRQQGARSAPILTYNFPGHTCISLNDEAAHGIPGKRLIRPGDLVNIDVSAELDGYFADTGSSFGVPPLTRAQRKLLATGRQALDAAIAAARAGQRLSVIGRAVERVARPAGFQIIRELGGHGVGRGLHEAPHTVPHYFNRQARSKLREGMVLTLEPFLTTGKPHIRKAADGWTLRTIDGALAAQFEHTVVITRGKPVLVTAL